MEFLLGVILLLLAIGVISGAISTAINDTSDMACITQNLFLICLGLVGAIAVVTVLGYGIYLMAGNIPGMP